MPWKEIKPMDARIQFIFDALKGDMSFADVCKEHQISRKTGYKWLNRYGELGLDGLREVSRSPKSFYNKTNTDNREKIIALKKEHPYWGAPKIKAYLSRHHQSIPSVATIGRILRSENLTRPFKRHTFRKSESKLTDSLRSNHVWSVDFKGEFKTKCGRYNYPLTIADHFSRSILGIHNLNNTALKETKKSFSISFKEHGLPEIIRGDNGTPFTGAYGPSKLSVWWMELGIRPELTEKGCPQQNGRHERMHRVLKEEAIDVEKYNFLGQSKRFQSYKDFYNNERPHQGLGNKTPSEVYRKSPRQMPEKIRPYDYPKYKEVRRVGGMGRLQFLGHRYFISNAFEGKDIGIHPIGDGIWEVHFRDYRLGTINTYYNTFNGVYLEN